MATLKLLYFNLMLYFLFYNAAINRLQANKTNAEEILEKLESLFMFFSDNINFTLF